MKKYSFLLMMASAQCASHEKKFEGTMTFDQNGTMSSHTLNDPTINKFENKCLLAPFSSAITITPHQINEYIITMKRLPYLANEFFESVKFPFKKSMLCKVRFPNTCFNDAPQKTQKIKKTVIMKHFNELPDDFHLQDGDHSGDIKPIKPSTIPYTEELLSQLNTPANGKKWTMQSEQIYDMERSVQKENNDSVFTCAIDMVDERCVLIDNEKGQRYICCTNDNQTINLYPLTKNDDGAIDLNAISNPSSCAKVYAIPDDVQQYTCSLRKIPEPT